MTIGGIGNTGIDYTKLTSRQLEQQETQQESDEAQVQANVMVQQKAQPSGAQDNTGGSPTYSTAQTQTSAVAAAAQQIAESLESDSDSEDTNSALISKANSGMELTQAELSQLKSLDSALYAQALKAQKAREEVRAQMSRDPSSAAGYAKQAIANAVQQDDSNAVKAIMDEYTNFATKYDQVDFGNNLFR
jgi:hypothetical protein